MRRLKGPGDVVVTCIHWGSNWGYDVPRGEVQFAHWLVEGGIDNVGANVKVTQEQMRHSDPRITLGICGHVIGDVQHPIVRSRFKIVDSAALTHQPPSICALNGGFCAYLEVENATWPAEQENWSGSGGNPGQTSAICCEN
jgi:hypothetical protein